jgi:nucleotide-binding universal stress UspA family protein
MYKHILMPYDGSPLSDRALAHGVSLAKSVGAKVSLYYLVTPHHLF